MATTNNKILEETKANENVMTIEDDEISEDTEYIKKIRGYGEKEEKDWRESGSKNTIIQRAEQYGGNVESKSNKYSKEYISYAVANTNVSIYNESIISDESGISIMGDEKFLLSEIGNNKQEYEERERGDVTPPIVRLALAFKKWVNAMTDCQNEDENMWKIKRKYDGNLIISI